MATERRMHQALAIQVAITLAGLGWVTLAPPATGTALVIPLGSARAVRVLALPGVALRGKGAWPGSLLIESDGALFWRALRQGLLVVRARAERCGAKESER